MTAAAGVAKDPNHEEIFIERYTQLLKWASQLTKHDRELAKDLVQEAFLQFTLADGDLLTINNIDNYLYGVVRNAYLSHIRRSSRQLHVPLPSIEVDAARDSLPTFDPRRQIKIRDELRAICRHACARKETSITGSVLILRFFHGYVPSEIAKLINTSRNIVDVQLRSARSEAIASLGKRHSSYGTNIGLPFRRLMKTRVRLAPDLLTELREEIFTARRGECLESNQLKSIYRSHKTMPRATLSHMVSCQQCLDKANQLMGLPMLRERNAIDVLGRASDPAELQVIYPFVKGLSFIGGPLWLVFASMSDLLS